MAKQLDCQAAGSREVGTRTRGRYKTFKVHISPQVPRDLFVPARLHSLKVWQHSAWCHQLELCI